jgi:Protein of unknown function (DUF3106)
MRANLRGEPPRTARDESAARLAPRSASLLIVVAVFVAGGASSELAARRSHIEKMTPAEQEDLLRRQERFATLPPEEQRRLRELQASIDADPHALQLQHVLKNYHEWLKTLSPSQRAELADLGPADRVAQIKRVKQQQDTAREQARQAEVLTSKDMQEIVRWTEDLLWAHRDRFVPEMLPARREGFEQMEPAKQRQALLYFMYDRSRRGGTPGTMSLVHQKDIDRLMEKLSPAAKEALAHGAGVPSQKRIVLGWIGTAMHRVEARPGFRKLPSWVDSDLVHFFQNDLKPAERERLLKLPREQMMEELRKIYSDREGIEPGISPAAPGGARYRGGSPGERHKGPRGGARGNPSAESSKAEKEPLQ